jgi:hypothetical protein
MCIESGLVIAVFQREAGTNGYELSLSDVMSVIRQPRSSNPVGSTSIAEGVKESFSHRWHHFIWSNNKYPTGEFPLSGTYGAALSAKLTSARPPSPTTPSFSTRFESFHPPVKSSDAHVHSPFPFPLSRPVLPGSRQSALVTIIRLAVESKSGRSRCRHRCLFTLLLLSPLYETEVEPVPSLAAMSHSPLFAHFPQLPRVPPLVRTPTRTAFHTSLLSASAPAGLSFHQVLPKRDIERIHLHARRSLGE